MRSSSQCSVMNSPALKRFPIVPHRRLLYLLLSKRMKPSNLIGEYLLQRLYDHGVRHVFGIPGDYVLGFYDVLQHSALKTINTCDEQGAGFAADAYARVRGLGAVCITYCVGGLKVANA